LAADLPILLFPPVIHVEILWRRPYTVPPEKVRWMRALWQSLNGRLQQPVDPSVPIVARRFAFRFLIVMIFAALPLPHSWGFSRMFIVLTGFNALTCFVTALLLHEKPNTHALSHYDEGLWMAVLCVTVRLYVGSH